jgi:hypothetical protein
MTPEQIKKARERSRKYYLKNRDKVKSKIKKRYQQNREEILQKIRDKKEQAKKTENNEQKAKIPRNVKITEDTIKERDLYLELHKARIFRDVRKALEIAESTDTSNRRYSKEVQPIIQIANLGVVKCPACGRFDNDFKIRGGLCLDCFSLMMNKYLKQQEERKINEANHVKHA